MWGNLEAHRQSANQLAIDLHWRIATSHNLVSFHKAHCRIVSRHPRAHRVRQQPQITKPVRRFDNTNLKLRFVEPRSRRDRKIAAVARRFSDRGERRIVLTPVDLQRERMWTPRREMTQPRNPKRAFADSFFQPRTNVTHDRRIEANPRHQRKVPAHIVSFVDRETEMNAPRVTTRSDRRCFLFVEWQT